MDNAGGVLLEKIELAVGKLLESDYIHKTRRDELVVAIQSNVDSLRAEVKNPLDKRYKAVRQAAEDAEALLGVRR